MSACVLVMPPSEEPPGAVATFEIPKSSSLTRTEPSLRRARNRFAGFKSRWTIPAAWASPRPSHACIAYSMASAIGGVRRRLQERVEVSPLEVLHDEIRRAALERAHVRHARHVLALDPRGRAGLAEEAPDGLGARRRVRACA